MRRILTAILILLLTGCQTYQLDDDWPTSLPERKIFINAYLDRLNKNKATDAELGYHLGWIKKFYQGTTLYPDGWLSVSDQFIASLEAPNKRAKMTKRVERLGIKIANEWAHANEVRLINNANIATWGSALRTAAEKKQHWSFLAQVERDVKKIINGDLLAKDISYERYFPEEIYDDF